MRNAEIIETGPDQTLAFWGDTFIIIFHRNTTVPGVAALANAASRFAEARPNGIGTVTIVEETAPMPPSDARAALAKALDDHSERVRVSAVAYEGTGFRAAAVRSVVAGLTMVARQPYPHKVFATVEEAMVWMAPQLPSPTSGQDLIDIVATLRQTIRQEAAAEQ